MKGFGMLCAPDLLALPVRDDEGRIIRGIVLGEITSQNQAMLVVAASGEFKAHPTTGVGAMRYLRDDSTEDFIAAVCAQLRGDGMKVISVSYSDDLKIDADYDD